MGEAMKAAVAERYGPPEVIEIREVPEPVPGAGELLVRVTATTVNSGDARMRALRVPTGLKLPMRLMMGWSGPRRPIGGYEAAGLVEAIGGGVSKFEPGDRVVGSHGFKFGLHAERAIFDETDALVKIPDGLSDVDAVSILFGGSTARHFLNRGNLKAGQRVLINGASGAVGVFAVQLAKLAGAEVTGVCSAKNADMVRALGADQIIAYDQEDFVARGGTYDIIMDTHGNAPFGRVRGLLAEDGKFLMVAGDLPQMISGLWQKQVIQAGGGEKMVSAEAYGELMALAAAGKLRPVIDTVFPFERIAAAHALADSERKRGSAVVTVP